MVFKTQTKIWHSYKNRFLLENGTYSLIVGVSFIMMFKLLQNRVTLNDLSMFVLMKTRRRHCVGLLINEPFWEKFNLRKCQDYTS